MGKEIQEGCQHQISLKYGYIFLSYIIKPNKSISRCIYVDTEMSYKRFLWPVYTENKMAANMVIPRKEGCPVSVLPLLH